MKKNVIIISIISFLIFFLIFLLYPRLDIKNKNMIISVNEEYKDPGYDLHNLLFKLNNKVKVNGNVDTKKLGNYKVYYTSRILFISIKKVRNIKVVDNEKPKIELNYDIDKICKNTDIKKLEYKAFDNYDGDITEKVKVELIENKLVYTVSDSSSNKTILTKKVEFITDNSPILNLKGSEVIYLYKGSNYKDPGYIASDECDGDITNKVNIEGNVNTNRIGTYKITYSVINSNNKETRKERKVVILERKNIGSNIGNGKIYLTFDDGPSTTITSKLLDILKEENVKATFFVTNKSNTLNYLIKREYDEGHTVGLHTASHDYKKIYSSSESYFNDLNIIENKVKNITGKDSKIIRFPGGSSNTISKKYQKGIMTYLTNEVINRGYIYFDWNISSGDAGGAKNSNDVYYNVTSKLSKDKTNIVLMHDFENNYKTLNAIRDIIKYGKDNGYTFDVITKDTPQIVHHVNN